MQVERFEAPAVLRDSRIIYYTSPTELNFLQYHRWSSDPAELLSDLAVKYFADAGLFQQVYSYPAPIQADFTLRGRVLDLDEIKYEKDARGKFGEARLGLKFDLLRAQQNKVVWSARLEQTAPVERNGVPAVVDAMNVAADRVFQNACRDISQIVDREFMAKQN